MSVKLPPFQVLLDEHRVDLYRYLVATAGPVEADDVYQETWIAALRAYPRLRRPDNLRAWLFRIAQNKAIDAHRARGRRALPVADPPEPAGAKSPRAPTSSLDGEPSSAAPCSACPTGSSPCCLIPPRRRRGATSTKA